MGSSHCSNDYDISCFIHTVHKPENERADAAAKAALHKDVTECLISYTDSHQYIGQYVGNLSWLSWIWSLQATVVWNNSSIHDIFENVSIDNIVSFVKRTL